MTVNQRLDENVDLRHASCSNVLDRQQVCG